MTTQEDIRNIAKIAYGESIDAIYDEDAMFEGRDVEWFIESNLGRLYAALNRAGFTDDDIMDAAKDIGREPEDVDDAKEIVAAEMEEEFSYLMGSWWDARIEELTVAAKVAPAGKVRVYRVYTEAPTAEFTHYTGTDFDAARCAAIDEYDRQTWREREHEGVILCYVDYPAGEVKEFSGEELRNLICGATEETRAVKAVWNRRL